MMVGRRSVSSFLILRSYPPCAKRQSSVQATEMCVPYDFVFVVSFQFVHITQHASYFCFIDIVLFFVVGGKVYFANPATTNSRSNGVLRRSKGSISFG
eukprot:m.136920 g.136920  ORF g.136920 m.136920 type:complete len:98 (-) comp13147_c4_seq10:1628-1921(-)